MSLPRRAQQVTDAVTLRSGQGPGRHRPRLGFCGRPSPQAPLGRLTAMPPQPGRHTERPARPGQPDPAGEQLDLGVQLGGELPSALRRDSACQSAETFPCASINSFATLSSASSRATRARMPASSAALRSLGLRPAGLSDSASSAPRSRWARHSLINDDYRPSRRQISPTDPASPDAFAASISARTRSLYSAGHDRFARRTSVSFALTTVIFVHLLRPHRLLAH